MNFVVLISTPNCKACNKIKHYLKSNNIPYNEYKQNDFIMNLYGNAITSFPTVIVHNESNKPTVINEYSPTKLKNLIGG